MSAIPTSGGGVYLRLPHDKPDQPSHLGFVVSFREWSLTTELAGPATCSIGDLVEVQFLDGPTRWRVGATVQSFLCGGLHPLLRLSLIGVPVRAERRCCVRISTAAAGCTAVVGHRHGCPVLNVSAEGLAILTPSEHRPGDTVELALASDNEAFAGRARVAHVLRRSDGRWRCGLHVADEQAELRRGLQNLVASVQRQQLQRVALRA